MFAKNSTIFFKNLEEKLSKFRNKIFASVILFLEKGLHVSRETLRWLSKDDDSPLFVGKREDKLLKLF